MCAEFRDGRGVRARVDAILAVGAHGPARVRRAAICALLGLLVASCGGGSSGGGSGGPSGGGGSTIAQQIATCEAGLPAFVADASPTALTVNVDQGPCGYGVPYGSPSGTAKSVFVVGAANVPFTTVTICVPNAAHTSATCQTIPHVLIDTGSTGVRIMASVLNSSMLAALPAVTSGSGPVYQCLQLGSGNSWGSLRTADVVLSNQPSGISAANQTVHIIGDSENLTTGVNLNTCAGGTSSLNDDVVSLQANGILGVSHLAQDCGTYCTSTAGNTLFFNCASATTACTGTTLALALQPSNPVLALPAPSNNGVVLQLAALPAGASTATSVAGRLVFGVNAQSAPSFAQTPTIYPADPANIAFLGVATYTHGSVTYSSAGNTTNAYVDSGSNGYYLPDVSISDDCSTAKVNGLGWYATPPSPVPSGCTTPAASAFPVLASVQLPSISGAAPAITITVNDASVMFQSSTAAVFAGLGSPAGTSSSDPNWGLDLGLPFFFGRSVGVVAQGQSASVPVSVAGPAWLF